MMNCWMVFFFQFLFGAWITIQCLSIVMMDRTRWFLTPYQAPSKSCGLHVCKTSTNFKRILKSRWKKGKKNSPTFQLEGEREETSGKFPAENDRWPWCESIHTNLLRQLFRSRSPARGKFISLLFRNVALETYESFVIAGRCPWTFLPRGIIKRFSHPPAKLPCCQEILASRQES